MSLDRFVRLDSSSPSSVLAEERVPMAPWAHVALLSLIAWGVYAAFAGHGAVAAPLVVLAAWFLLASVRTVVTRDEVRIRLGVFGPTLPTARIVSAEAIDGMSFLTLGWGIRFSLGGTITYSVPAFGRRYLRIAYTNDRGRPRVVRVMSLDPDALVRAIERARAA
ncbi:hypothetical protein EON77_04110 [bacterium]|nr:MAG: hypothetical protein EON77_04110 [bacterium]